MRFFSLLRSKLRGLTEGRVQRVRADSLADDAKDDVERWQDYGLASNPGDGEGLVLHFGGHTVVIRMDRIAERPQLEAYEVALWHKEGHMVRLKAGRVVEISGDRLVANMGGAIELNSASLAHNGVNIGATHVHGGIQPGGADTSTPH